MVVLGRHDNTHEPTSYQWGNSKYKCRKVYNPGGKGVDYTLCRLKRYGYSGDRDLYIEANITGSQGRFDPIGKGLFSIFKNAGREYYWQVGLKATNTDVEAKIAELAARQACSAGAYLARSSLSHEPRSPWWERMGDEGHIAFKSGTDIDIDLGPHESLPEPCKLFPKKPRKVSYLDMAGKSKIPPEVRAKAKCSPFVRHGDRFVSVCRSRYRNQFWSGFDQWRGFDITVAKQSSPKLKPKKGWGLVGLEVIGQSLFTEYADQVWTEGVEAADADTRLDMELLGARLACALGKELVSTEDPESSYFWRSKVLEGRTKKVTMKRKGLSRAETCRGVPLYTKKGVLERVKRRPKIY